MKVGETIPEVLGRDERGETLTREMLKGRKWVLYAYPRDNTAGCTAEACALRDARADLEAMGCGIIGVSRDSEASHRRFIEKHGLNFPLIADTEATLLREMGAWGEKRMCGKVSIGTIRTTLLLDERGVVLRRFEAKEIKVKEHGKQVLEALEGLNV